MRIAPLLAGLAAAALAQNALAAPVTLTPVAYSAEFQTELDENLGVREGAHLSDIVARVVSRELTRRGATLTENAPLTIELIIIDADPNRPTFQQLADRPGLDYFRSVSVGGAELRAVLRDADGHVLREVTHKRFDYSLADLIGAPNTWTTARQAIWGFAAKVGDAYDEVTP